MKVTIEMSQSIELPKLPNYLKRGESMNEMGEMVDVADLSDAALKIIGECWTNELIAHAARRRKIRKENYK